MKLKLKARVDRSDARTIRHALELSAKGPVRKAGDEFVVEAEMEEGASSRDLNRTFLSALEKGREENDAPRGMGLPMTAPPKGSFIACHLALLCRALSKFHQKLLPQRARGPVLRAIPFQ